MVIVVTNSRKQERWLMASELRAHGHDVLEAGNIGDAFEWGPPGFEHLDMLISCEKTLPMLLQKKSVRDIMRDKYIIVIAPQDCLEKMSGVLRRDTEDGFRIRPVDTADIPRPVDDGSLGTLHRRHLGITRRTQDEVFLRLYNALETRHMETASHVYRIGNACACVGTLLGWDEARIDAIRWAAPLHDIGKIGISDAILYKPGPLTDKEFQIIKQHTVKGAHILSGSHNRVVRLGEVLALSHHENWDGSGYPHGLKGEEIPLEARVVAVADVYDALLADRVYRKKMSREQALSIIGNESGKKFDPAIVEVLMKYNDIIHSHFCI